MRRGHWIAVLLVLMLGVAVFLAACGGGTTTTTAPSTNTTAGTVTTAGTETTVAPSTGPIKIGQAVSLTGVSAAPAAAIAAATKEEVAYINANGGINGRQIELIVEDDKSDVNGAVAAMTKLIEQDKVAAVIGPFPQFVESAARAVSEKAGVPNILYIPPTLASLKDTSFKWTFLCTAGPDGLAEAELMLMQAEGYKNVLAIGDSLSIHQETLTLLKDSATAAGIKFTVMADTWNLDEQDVGPIVAKIAAQVKATSPDAIMVLSNPIHAPGIQKGLRALGVKQQIVGSPAGTSPAMFMQGPQDAEGMIAIGPGIVNAAALPDDYPGKADMVAFSTRFTAATKQPADFYAGFGYDALHLVVNAMTTAGSDDKAAVRDAIEATKGFQGMQGIITYSPTDHVGIHGGMAEWKIVNGSFKFIRALNPTK